MRFPFCKSHMLVVGGKATRWFPPIDLSTIEDKITNLKLRGYWNDL